MAFPAGTITTTGGQTYSTSNNDLNGNLTLVSATGPITLGAVQGIGDTLTVSAGSGDVTFNSVTLGGLAVATTGTVTLDTGFYSIGGGSPYNFGAVTLKNGTLFFAQDTGFGATTLAGDSTLATSSGTNNLSFGSTLSGGSHNLTVTDAGGTLTLSSGRRASARSTARVRALRCSVARSARSA